MNILILGSETEPGELWKQHLAADGNHVRRVVVPDCPFEALRQARYDVIVLQVDADLVAAMAWSDYASVRQPHARQVFVTAAARFSVGSLLSHMPNACAVLNARTRPSDLAAIVEHYAIAS